MRREESKIAKKVYNVIFAQPLMSHCFVHDEIDIHLRDFFKRSNMTSTTFTVHLKLHTKAFGYIIVSKVFAVRNYC